MKPTHRDPFTQNLLKDLQLRTDAAGNRAMSSDFEATPATNPLADLVLSDEDRGRMPLTAEKYLRPENPHLIQWEREVRKFLRKLTPMVEHRVTAIMIFEWATQIDVQDLYNSGGEVDGHLKHISRVLRHYFGPSKPTTIAGRKVKKAYRVKKNYRITTHKPLTNTLLAEYYNQTLNDD